jgi:hypothetical protein
VSEKTIFNNPNAPGEPVIWVVTKVKYKPSWWKKP